MIEIREAEPYSYCQFIMGRDHTPRQGKHPYIGSADSLLQTHICLSEAVFKGLIRPITFRLGRIHVKRRWRGAYYNIIVKTLISLKRCENYLLNGSPLNQFRQKGSINVVEVVMG